MIRLARWWPVIDMRLVPGVSLTWAVLATEFKYYKMN